MNATFVAVLVFLLALGADATPNECGEWECAYEMFFPTCERTKFLVKISLRNKNETLEFIGDELISDSSTVLDDFFEKLLPTSKTVIFFKASETVDTSGLFDEMGEDVNIIEVAWGHIDAELFFANINVKEDIQRTMFLDAQLQCCASVTGSQIAQVLHSALEYKTSKDHHIVGFLEGSYAAISFAKHMYEKDIPVNDLILLNPPHSTAVSVPFTRMVTDYAARTQV